MITRAIHFVIAVAMAILGTSVGLHAAEPVLEPLKIKSPRGLTFTYLLMPEAKTINIAAAWRTNWTETGGQPAVPFVGSDLMLSGGAGERDAADISADMEATGAKLNISPSDNTVKATLNVGLDDIDEAAEIEADILSKPSLEPRWLARIKAVQAANIRQNLLLQSNQTNRLIQNFVFGTRPVATAAILKPEALELIGHDAVVAWHSAVFNRNNVVIAAAGALPAERMEEIIDQVFGALPISKPLDREAIHSATLPASTILLYTPGIDNTTVSVAGMLPPRGPRPQVEAFFGAMALGSGSTSRLNASLRVELRASYGLTSRISNFGKDHRVLILEGQIEGAKLKQAMIVLEKAYGELRARGLKPDEFEALRNKVMTYLEAAHRQPSFVAEAMLEAELNGMEPGEGLRLLEDIRAVSLEQVNHIIASDFPAFEGMVKVVASPRENALDANCTIADPDKYQPCLQ